MNSTSSSLQIILSENVKLPVGPEIEIKSTRNKVSLQAKSSSTINRTSKSSE